MFRVKNLEAQMHLPFFPTKIIKVEFLVLPMLAALVIAMLDIAHQSLNIYWMKFNLQRYANMLNQNIFSTHCESILAWHPYYLLYVTFNSCKSRSNSTDKAFLFWIIFINWQCVVLFASFQAKSMCLCIKQFKPPYFTIYGLGHEAGLVLIMF